MDAEIAATRTHIFFRCNWLPMAWTPIAWHTCSLDTCGLDTFDPDSLAPYELARRCNEQPPLLGHLWFGWTLAWTPMAWTRMAYNCGKDTYRLNS